MSFEGRPENYTVFFIRWYNTQENLLTLENGNFLDSTLSRELINQLYAYDTLSPPENNTKSPLCILLFFLFRSWLSCDDFLPNGAHSCGYFFTYLYMNDDILWLIYISNFFRN